MLPFELFAPLGGGFQAAQVQSEFKDSSSTNLVDETFVPSRKLVGLDHMAGVEFFGVWSFDRRLGMEQDDMMKIGLLLGAPHDVKPLKQFAQHLFMALALFDRRGNAKARIPVLGRELSPVIDHQVAGIIFGLQQVDAARPTNDQVVDLRYFSVDHKTQVMKHHVVFGIPEVVVQVVADSRSP